MTIREAQTEGTGVLERAAIDSPSLDASLLLAHATGLDRGRLLTRHTEQIPENDLADYRRLIRRRAEGVCVAYLAGRKEFRGLDFSVTPAVLVPRPDTETLVEAAIAWIDARTARTPETAIRILDVCTGSGCVAVALKAERRSLSVSASDLSEEALSIARKNAEALVGGSIDFYSGDLLAPVPGAFDLIVSNPPYIPTAVVDGLAIEVRGEPRMALDGGSDGMNHIKRLIREAWPKLKSGGCLLMETGHDQGPEVALLMKEEGYVDIDYCRDLSGIPRVTGGSKP